MNRNRISSAKTAEMEQIVFNFSLKSQTYLRLIQIVSKNIPQMSQCSNPTTNPLANLQGNNSNIQISCCGNNQVFLLCINEKCTSSYSFICGSNQCKCQSEHQLCMKGNLLSVLKVVEKKIHKTDDIKAYVSQTVNKIIQEIKQFEEKLLDNIETDIKYTKLVEVERRFLSIVYQTDKSDQPFKPVNSALLWKIINSKEEGASKLFDRTKQLLKNLQEESKKSILKVNTSLLQVIADQGKARDMVLNRMAREIDYKVKSSLTNSQKTIVNELTKSSSLCKTEQLSERLIKFFPKRLKNMSLLFKASEHGFKLAKFYELCGLKTHTVILCQSDKGKIVGCYTPFSYYKQNLASNTYAQDPNRESFMFSLTNNDKFLLNQINYALYMIQNKSQLYFGNQQISIQDNSNTATNNSLRCNIYYINELYTLNTKQSYLSFNGNQSGNCAITEWQVWQVEFE